MPIPSGDLHRAAAIINQADGLIITAGAGMGIDSGLPDYRGNEGFWKAYPALGRAGINFIEAATPTSFFKRPEMAWGFYGHRLQLYRDTAPHEGFQILRRWGAARAAGCWVFTSNVDGQFQKAGFDPGRVVQCHGSIHRLQCLLGCGQAPWPAGRFRPDVDTDACLLRNAMPRCPQCNGLARPNVLLFGDAQWLGESYERAEDELLEWMLRLKSPVFVELGAGSAIPTVRAFGDRAPGPLVRVNPREPRVAWPKDVSIAAGALEALQALDPLVGH